MLALGVQGVYDCSDVNVKEAGREKKLAAGSPASARNTYKEVL